MDWSSQSVALLIALAFDVAFRELPNRWHPVAWMGTGIAMWRRKTSGSGVCLPLAGGSLLVACGSIVCGFVGWQVEVLSLRLPWLAAAVLQGVVLKQTLSIRSLGRAARGVEGALQSGDLDAARRELGYHLVSRDVSQLDETQVAAATIESVAENASDSIVAPLFFFAVAGLPGALVYRFINTCDAMIGYRTDELEWYGKAAARLDDVLNYLPARLTALIIIAVGGVIGWKPSSAIRIWFRDRRATASPNAGHPMSAAAGALGVELEKLGHYRLGRGLASPQAGDIDRAVRLLWLTAAVASLAALVALLCKGAIECRC